MAKYGQVSEVDYYRDLIPRRREENTRTVTVCWSNGYEISVTATSRLQVRSNNLAHPPDSYQVGENPGAFKHLPLLSRWIHTRVRPHLRSARDPVYG